MENLQILLKNTIKFKKNKQKQQKGIKNSKMQKNNCVSVKFSIS
jgi:hypothetical protein